LKFIGKSNLSFSKFTPVINYVNLGKFTSCFPTRHQFSLVANLL
jgi:hypothetical protein